jgi:beta-lactam-binding protein with PASTA domain
MVNKNTGITLTTIKKINPAPTTTDTDCGSGENDSCAFPNFVGKKLSEVISWEDKAFGDFIISKTPVNTNDEDLDNKVKSQSVTAGTKISDLPHDIEIKYYKYDASSDE